MVGMLEVNNLHAVGPSGKVSDSAMNKPSSSSVTIIIIVIIIIIITLPDCS